MFVVAEPPELPERDPRPLRPIEVNVPRAPAPPSPTATDAPVASGVARSVPDDPIEEAGRSLQDHDDVEESDRADREGSDDGNVVNGEFEGSSFARGHNISSSRSGAPESDDS